MGEESQVFGTKVEQYRTMLKIGVVIFTSGLFFIITSYFLFSGLVGLIFNMGGYLSFFVGLILAGNGYIGVRDELKKMGQRRKYTLLVKYQYSLVVFPLPLPLSLLLLCLLEVLPLF